MTLDTFPDLGSSDHAAILSELSEMRRDDLKADGKAFAFIYDAGDDVNALARQAFAAGMSGNGLDPTAYPSARRLENDLVDSCLQHLRGPKAGCGTVTSGGTESVMLSVKTARDYARKHRPHITAPTMLVPESAHACFHKAAHYLGVELIPIAIDPVTMRASMEDMVAKLSAQTILLVGSAPSYAHGVIDPIVEMGELAMERGLLLHVDACIGGWVLPFQRQNGVALADFDFQVPGVSSISVDLHKYAFAPKGISVLLQRDRALRDAQYYACASWSGYSIINSTMLGSKSLAPMAAAWAILKRIGKAGYRDLVAQMWTATQALVAGISSTDGLRVLGTPSMGLVALSAGEGDIFVLADRLSARGWHVQPTYAFGNSPAHLHFSVDPQNAKGIDRLIQDIKTEAVDLPKLEPAPEGLVQLVEAMTSSEANPEATLDAGAIMAEFGIVDGRLPAQQATIHRLLNSSSPSARERLLALFVGEMFSR